MSNKLSKIRLVSINGIPVIAPRDVETVTIKDWFERTEEIEVQSYGLLSLTARPERGEPTYAEQIEKREFTPDDLPMLL